VRKSLYFLTVVVLLIGYQMIPGRASSHREAPLISGDPQADNTDLYAFVSPDAPDTVTIIASYIPFENPQGGPNFYKFGDNVLYEIKIDNNGDGVEDITYQFRFTSQTRNPDTFLYNTGPITSGIADANRNLSQTYTMTRIENGKTTGFAGPMTTMYDNVGFASAPNYGGNGSGIYEFGDANGKGRVFAGQTDDAFFLDLRVFDLLYGANLSEAGIDSLAGFNVHSIALQVPKSSLRSASSPIIGVWATASRPTTTTRQAGSQADTGSFVQVSRLGMPLVNELVLPVGQKDKWNGSKPSDDARYFIPSKTLTARRFGTLIRVPLGIENSLHWVLDVCFREDDQRHWAGNSAMNLAWLRKMALCLLKAEKNNKGKSIATRRLLAGWIERAGVVDLRNLVIAEAKNLTQHLVGMFAEQR